ncbi:hypothetical protein PtA15_3A57 [Puccinia triticina]|uniref:Uncharacterized protein n=1 Tax=Puccinia triticina TaxID=208348 RepID=A0ABY7CEA0_9BASI|nr:uncharacterized protein PtA15_3A57 [Puccinia triticina]WAQ82693.1 hypothetical protein PtA15_3A57 [Puccinia triticina]WAR53538.1 hypothetical protein PtB15_3B46 [Puccinia triticina]
MSTNDATSAKQPGSNANGDSLPGHDEGWLLSLVDQLVPEFQQRSTAAPGETVMQTDQQGLP